MRKTEQGWERRRQGEDEREKREIIEKSRVSLKLVMKGIDLKRRVECGIKLICR